MPFGVMIDDGAVARVKFTTGRVDIASLRRERCDDITSRRWI